MMIHPQMIATLLTLLITILEIDTLLKIGGWMDFLTDPGNEIPTRIAEMICTSHNVVGVEGRLKTPPSMPKMNDGPALLQKAIILAALSLESMPLRYTSYTFFAPTGYPPNKPIGSSDSSPSGILQIRPIGRKR